MAAQTTDLTINTKDIMADIRRRIKEEGLSYSALSFEEIAPTKKNISNDEGYNISMLKSSMEYMLANYRTGTPAPDSKNPIKSFIKKIVRKLTNFIIQPLINEQNAFNYHSANAVIQLNDYISKNKDIGIVDADQRMEAIETRQINNRREIDELCDQIKQLKAEIAELRSKVRETEEKK